MDMSMSKLRELVMDREDMACCSPWGRKESDTTEWLSWTDAYLRQLLWKLNELILKALRTCSVHHNCYNWYCYLPQRWINPLSLRGPPFGNPALSRSLHSKSPLVKPQGLAFCPCAIRASEHKFLELECLQENVVQPSHGSPFLYSLFLALVFSKNGYELDISYYFCTTSS